jgi:hypothetical protein
LLIQLQIVGKNSGNGHPKLSLSLLASNFEKQITEKRCWVKENRKIYLVLKLAVCTGTVQSTCFHCHQLNHLSFIKVTVLNLQQESHSIFCLKLLPRIFWIKKNKKLK